MENNIIKDNYLSVIDNKGVIATAQSDIIPIINRDNKLLLPVIVPVRELSLVEVTRELNDYKLNKTLENLAKLTKAILRFIVKLAKAIALISTNIAIFICTSIIIVSSVAVITKNIVNSFYDAKVVERLEDYSVYEMKGDDFKK